MLSMFCAGTNGVAGSMTSGAVTTCSFEITISMTAGTIFKCMGANEWKTGFEVIKGKVIAGRLNTTHQQKQTEKCEASQYPVIS